MRAVLTLTLCAGLTACASSVDDANQCGWVSGYQDPPETERDRKSVV